MKFTSKAALKKMLVACVIACATISTAYAADNVALIVNGQKITVDELKKVYNSLPEDMKSLGFEKVYPDLVDNMALDTVLQQQAEKSDIQKTTTYQQQLKIVERKFLIQAYINDYVNKHLKESQLKDFYKNISKNIQQPVEAHVLHIAVDKVATANAIIKQLKAGTSFQSLMKKYSGNDLGYITSDHVTPDIAKAIFTLNKGQFTSKPLLMENKYHVMYILDKRKHPKPTFEELKPRIKSIMGQKIANTFITENMKHAKVERFDLNGKPMPTNKKVS